MRKQDVIDIINDQIKHATMELEESEGAVDSAWWKSKLVSWESALKLVERIDRLEEEE